ncbi:hypothetical protein SK128_005286 [Halocaridina rubra]|uniref:RING-type domain-containing protein n=1 Tax=Halocaridina rubra TaxID=373956 RepID=A0AAN8XKE4_HALRR
MAADIAPTECGVCHELFDEAARCPRILECFHYLCTNCIQQMIQNEKYFCPYCRRAFTANTAADVKINTGMLELVKYIAKTSLQDQPAKPQESPLRDKNIVCDFKRDSTDVCSKLLLECIEAQDLLETWLATANKVKELSKKQNDMINMEILPKVSDIVSANTKEIRELDNVTNKFQAMVKEVKSKHAQLVDVKGKLDSSNTIKEAAAVVLKAEESNEEADKLLATFDEEAFVSEELLGCTRKKFELQEGIISTLLDVLDTASSPELQSNNAKGIVSSALFGDVEVTITMEDFVSLSAQLERLVKNEKIFVIQKQLWKRRAAKLSICNGKLLLHHLQEGTRHLNVLKVEYEHLECLINNESTLVFLELAAHGLNLGKIYIRLSSNSHRAKFFTMLCTGELGYSYASTKLLEVGFRANEWEYVKAGDYELNNGSGGKLLLTNPSTETLTQTPWSAGVVEAVWGRGNDIAAQFIIRTRSNPGYVCSVAFGIVEEGLDILRTAIRCYENINDVIIKDCGVVLSPSLSKVKLSEKFETSKKFPDKSSVRPEEEEEI